MKNKIKCFIKGLLFIIVYFLSIVFLSSLLRSIFPKLDSFIYELISQVIIISILIFIYYDDLKKDFKNLKNENDKKNILLFIIIYLLTEGLFLLFYKKLNIIVTNQENIMINFNKNKFLMLLYGGLLSPICEEVFFRKNFKNAFKSKWLFLIVTGIMFGSIHVISIKSLIELIYLPLYIILGMFLGYVYYDSDNILISMKYHILNNLLGFIVLLFL